MSSALIMRPIDILLVEDNPADVRLTEEALKDARMKNRLAVAKDGEEAIRMLRETDGTGQRRRPDLILLDLNLPKLDGRELLEEIKRDEALRSIPVVVLTTSDAREDIVKSYQNFANCYITKPVAFEEFLKVIHSIEDFWLTIVKLPPEES